MTLQEYYYIGELVAAVAIIISLIYLAVQVRLSTQATRAAAAQAYVDTNNGFVGLINQTGTLGDILFRGAQALQNLSNGERVRFSAFYDQCFVAMESNFFLWRDGVLDERLWDTHRHALVELLHMAGLREWWQSRAHWFSPDFQEYVARSVEQVQGRPMYFWAAEV